MYHVCHVFVYDTRRVPHVHLHMLISCNIFVKKTSIILYSYNTAVYQSSCVVHVTLLCIKMTTLRTALTNLHVQFYNCILKLSKTLLILSRAPFNNNPNSSRAFTASADRGSSLAEATSNQ